MNLITPNKEVKKLVLQVGDILVDSTLGEWMLMQTRDGKYMFRPLDGHDGGYNGVHDSLRSITEQTQKTVESRAKDGKDVTIYKNSEWDLKLVPKGDN